MSLHLITGYAGEEHITSSDHASFNIAMFGDGEFVLDKGNKFEASVITNNLIRISDGDLMLQGRHVRLKENSYEELELENGSQGMYRNDLIVVRYSKASVTGIEKCEFVVLKGEASSTQGVDPTYTTGDITEQGNALITEFPLYRIKYDGLNIQEVRRMFKIKKMLSNSIVPTYKSITLENAGWHRIAKIECSSLNEANGNMGNSCDIEINRSYNDSTTEFKKIQLVSLYRETKFSNEISHAVSGSQILTKIRHTVDTVNNVGYIEVYYNSDKRNSMTVTLSNHINNNSRVWEIIEPELTEETVSNINVLGAYNFNLNTNLYQMTLENTGSSYANKPYLVIKDEWENIPVGMTCFKVNCGSAYGCFCFKLNDTYGKIHILTYGGASDIHVLKTTGGWSYMNASVGNSTTF